MTEEEKKAIEYFKERIDICSENANICDENDFNEEATQLREEKRQTETILNLLQRKQEKIEKLKEDNKKLDLEAQGYLEQLLGDNSLTKRLVKQLNEEIEKKDKIIDLMATYIGLVLMENNDTIFCNRKMICDKNCANCIKQYFEKKVEGK